MTDKSAERKTDLRNTSVMEVILAVIIVLLCFIHMKDHDLIETKNSMSLLIKKINEQRLEIENLYKENKKIKRRNRALNQELKNKKEQINRLKKMIAQSPEKGGFRNTLQTEFDKLQDKYNKLKIQHSELAHENEELRSEIKRLKDEISNLRVKANIIDKSKQGLADQIVLLKNKIKELKKLLEASKKLAQPIGKGGIDKPRCQVAGRELSKIAHLDKLVNRYKFKLKGDTRQQSALMQVPGISELVNSSPLTLSQFKTHANRVNKFALKQTPQCVFYISIDSDKMTGNEIKIIERYFYKAWGRQ